MQSVKNIFNQKGFSLFELLIVMAFMAIIGAVGLGHYFNFQRQVTLRTTTDEIVAFLHTMQERSKSQHNASQWGVRFTNPTGGGAPLYSSFSFQGSPPLITTPITPIETRFLDRMLDFSLPADGASIDIVFDRISGSVTDRQFRQIHITLMPGEATLVVKVSPVGVISQDMGEVGWWRFDEGSGIQVIDSSGMGNTGTLSLGTLGNTTPANAWVEGVSGGALSFDGADDFVDVGNSSILQPAIGSVQAWVHLREHKGQVIWTGSTGGAARRHGSIDMISSGIVRLYISNNVSAQIVENITIIPLNRWVFLTGTWNGTRVKIYIDGILDRNEEQTIVPAGTIHAKRIGALNPPAFPLAFNGIIDEVRIYNRALSASEVRANFNAGRR